MSLSYMSPLSEIREQIDRLFADFSEEMRMPTMKSSFSKADFPATSRAEWLPPIEVSETDKEVVVCAALPGLKPEDIQVEMVGDTLVLSGETQREAVQDEKQFHRSEFHYGSFMRRIPLPEYVKGEATTADFKDGVLALRIPKTEEAARKRIEVKKSE